MKRVRPDWTKSAGHPAGHAGWESRDSRRRWPRRSGVALGDIQEDLCKETPRRCGIPVLSRSSCRSTLRRRELGTGHRHDDQRARRNWTSSSTTPASRSPELVIDLNPDRCGGCSRSTCFGTALGIKHAFRAMRPGGPAGEGGAVVNISSVAATIAFPGIAGYLRHQVRGGPAHPGGGDGVWQAGLRRPGQLRLPGTGRHRDGRPARSGRGRLGLFPSVDEAIGAVIGLTPGGRLGRSRGHGGRRCVPRLRRSSLHHRRRAARRRRHGM